MELPDDLAQPLAIDVRVDLRGGDVGVPEEFLHHAKVRATHDQVRGEGMAQRVRVHVLQAGHGGVLLHELPDRHALERPAAEGEQQAMLVAAIRKTREFRPQVAQVTLRPLDRRQPHGHHPLLAALAEDDERAKGLVEVVDLERADLARAQPARIHELEHAPVAQPQRAAGLGIGRFDELAHLADAQRAGHALPLRRAVDQSCRVLRDLALGMHPPEVHTQRSQMAGDACRLHTALSRELLDVLGHVRHRHGTRIGNALLAEEPPQVAQIARVGLDGGLGQTGFDAAERQELAHAGPLRRWRAGLDRRRTRCSRGARSDRARSTRCRDGLRRAWSRGLAHGTPSVRASCPVGGCVQRPRGRSWHATMPRG